MNDRFQAIRDALALNPTPGPRRVSGGDSYPYVTVALGRGRSARGCDMKERPIIFSAPMVLAGD